MDLKSEYNQVNMNDSYQLENDNSSNGYHPLNNNNNNFIDSSPKRSDSPLDDNNRRSRSRSFDRHSNNNNRRSYSRSRSPRNRNQDYSNDNRQSRRNDNRNRNSNSGSGSRYTDRELGLKYRWEKTVFVSNIPYDVKWPELKDLFKSKIGEIHFCEIFERDNKSLGVGTIEFKLLEDAEKAVELMNQYDLGTRKISVRMDSDGSRTRKYKEMTRDFGRQNQSNYDNQQQSQQTANLLSAINSTSLLAALGLGNNGQQTSPVSPSNASSSPQALNTQNILSLLTQLGSSNNSNMNNNNNNNSSPNQVNLLNQLAQQNKIEGPVTNRIFVASLDYKVDEYKIREVFSLAGTVLNVSLFKDRDGKSRGMSVIEYTTPTQALNAVLMFNNQVLNNRTMNVRFDTKPPGKDDDGFQQSSSKLPSGLKSIGLGLGLPSNNKPSEVSSNPLVNSLEALTALTAGINNGSNSTGLSALAGLAGLGAGNLGGLGNLLGSFNSNASKPSSMSKISKIFIKNIPFSWDERKLKEKFRQAGHIDFVEIKHRDGKSRGCGLIKFSTPDQAMKAVELFNGSRFEGRTLEVKLDQLDK